MKRKDPLYLKTVRSWRTHALPNQEFARELFEILSNGDRKLVEEAKVLLEAAQDERDGESYDKKFVAIPEIEDEGAVEQPAPPPEPVESDFDPFRIACIEEGLCALRIVPPDKYTNMPNLYPIRVELSFDTADTMLAGLGCSISLSDAMLTARFSDGCDRYGDSRAGEADNESATMIAGPDMWRIIGPVSNQKTLHGSPLKSGQPLLTLRTAGQPDDGMRLTLYAKPRSLLVDPDPDDNRTDDNRAKIIQAMVQKSAARFQATAPRKVHEGFVVLASARIARKKPA